MTLKTNDIRRNLLGCLEIMLFMPVGKTRFSADKSEAIRSFALYFLYFPLAIAIVYSTPVAAKLGQSFDSVTLLYGLNIALSTIGAVGMTYMLAKFAGKSEHFFQFLNAFNWLALPGMLAVIPVIYLVTSGQHSWEEVKPLLTILTLYGCAYTAFMTTHVLRVPWELGTSVAISGMLIGDLSFRTILWLGSMI